MINININTPTHKPNFHTHFTTQADASFALWLATLAKDGTDLTLVICQSQSELQRLADELHFFGVSAHVFADYETLVYDNLSVHQDIISERIDLLTHMPTRGVLLVSVQTLMQKITPPSYLLGRFFDLNVGDNFDIERERERLAKAGYKAVDNVYMAGEFAVRGSIVDIFAVGQALPFRLELFDDEIETIKFFNPDTQRTVTDEELDKLKKDGVFDDKTAPTSPKVASFRLLPAREFDLDDKETFRQNFASLFPNASARKVEFYNDVMNGIQPSGVEYYAPLFFDLHEWQTTGTLFHYLPKNTLVVCDDNLSAHHHNFWEQVNARYHSRAFDKDVPILPPDYLYLPSNEFFQALKTYPRAVFQQPFVMSLSNHDGFPPPAGMAQGERKTANGNKENPLSLFRQFTAHTVPNLPINHQKDEPLGEFLDFVGACDEPILLVCESAGRREIILELLKGKLDSDTVADFGEFLANLDKFNPNKTVRPEPVEGYGFGKIALTVAPIERGLWLKNEQNQGFCVISETQIFGRVVATTKRKRQNVLSQAFLIKSVSEMTEGSLVVHLSYGIGRYQGLVVLDVGEGEQEFIHIKYADDANVYVPITNLALIGRYSGTDSEAVQLSKLGSGKWDKARQKSLTDIYDVAAELLNVQARRNAKQGIRFDIDMASYELFASGFAYDETPDQQSAIEAVMFDMKQTKPMDRLICGDVGFGKTEVAMRAAFIAVQAGYQVALLVPTTLLAGQHEDSFKDRFADWAIKIESLSRFSSKKAQDKVLASLADGKVDIIIGTHRLLQDDVRFKNLGLMIIDEEHRFGVRHKEKIKAMQADVDTLTMTATPIPRTLNMALSGMQDISIIATPPARRLAIKTFVAEKNEQTTKDAILREILRGGQVYYLHNDVASIDTVAENLSELIPEVRVGVAHGQMAHKELHDVMSDFYHKKTNVLVASTIIETGIDVPNANTIIINRADKFGLAQLHQLRGRVGRSHHQAYCYLFVPSIKGLTADAKKRLDAISRANTLGAGFMLASEDLEIRGAGEILGKEQSGNMQTIGFGLYMDMLERATKAIKSGNTPSLATPLDLVSDINIHASALIPSDYLADVHERLLCYKRIANAETMDELNEMRAEMIDRFGAMPTALANLFLVHKMRVQSIPLGIGKIDVTAHGLSMEFKADMPVDGLAIIKLIQSNDGYRMNGATGLKYTFKDEKDVVGRTNAVFELLKYLHGHIIKE
ncbi:MULTISPECIES: transcription-repair coupling factor [Moraxella]|uniref:Transcription-repair-coupling factor n=2 Tax=Moraxellaceae TaxID=468 RepID=A0A1B8PXU7_MORLA|nr:MULTISPECIES: transcription-repair coupling factor [Moraxella]MDH9218314.1 transcription-repair coupling factor [Moraxella lacunata]OBX60832.1 transcription-repair coupling factor [Moraxella lacunata]OBX63026.1 transcription-repair coupling factor [Moraxella lacunata]